MASNLDETELARLEKLALRATAVPYHYFENSLRDGHGNQIAEITQDHDDFAHDIHDTAYIAAACNAVPALVAEVRRLRRNYECSEKSLQRHEHMVAELMEKVEAWEWFGECRSLILWRGPENEMWEIFNAAREAVHADRD